MIITKLTLSNFGLFKSAEVIPDKINLAKGINFDADQNGNASGKSTLLKNSILFVLYGEGGKKLDKLIHKGTKEAEVNIVLNHHNKNIIISRKIPSALKITEDGKDLEFNTPTIAQNYINKLFGDYDFFKKYCLIDLKAINLLNSLQDSRSIITLKKELMAFIETEFAPKRESLLKKKSEREEKNVDKRLYKFSLSERRLQVLNDGLEKIQQEMININKDIREQNEIINNLRGDIDSKKKLIYFKEQDKIKMNGGYCPILKYKCKSLEEKLDTVMKEKTREIANLQAEIIEIESKLTEEKSCMEYYNILCSDLQKKKNNIQSLIMKLEEAFKFSEYKYTKADIQLYVDSIKTLDLFSGSYIQEWMNNLALIINYLLKELNLSILFDEKEFIKIKDGDTEFTWEDLSGGQQEFFSAIFKLAILLQKGDSDRIIICDDGLGAMHEITFRNFIKVCQNLPMQFFIIYQNPLQIENVNYINIERKLSISYVK